MTPCSATVTSPMNDPDLESYRSIFTQRSEIFTKEIYRLHQSFGSLAGYADLHLTFGMHKIQEPGMPPCWRWREWMPAAEEVWLAADVYHFQRRAKCIFRRLSNEGLWELTLPLAELPHGTYIELRVSRNGQEERRVPAFAVWVEQDARVKEQWCARVWNPPVSYVFQNDHRRKAIDFPYIYEAHVGIAQAFSGREEESVGTYEQFATDMLPRIKKAGYTVVQLMGILEHPLYKSFGYQVSSYFAPSSRFGSPEACKKLIDDAHALGLAVVLDIPHSHACPNTEQGLASYDMGNIFFADKENQWGTLSFDYDKEFTRRFLLSNCRYWLEEYHVDGFRFDAVGNMIYVDHGRDDDFNQVQRCFYKENGELRADESGCLYLSLVNTLVHEITPHAITIAEEFSGMPGMTSAPEQGGLGFDYRFAMGIPDFWGKFIKEGRSIGEMWYELTNHRSYERTISYVECHDQCINGKDAMIWRLIGDDMYRFMGNNTHSWKTDRGVDLYKIMRLMTLGTADCGYLNFMGNEFGHPEWIDGEAYAHRQWHLGENPDLKYAGLASYDHDLLQLTRRHLDEFQHPPELCYIHEEQRIIAFRRGRFLFVCNMHETKAQPSLEIYVTPGNYVECFGSDEPGYAGHGNLNARKGTEHFSLPQKNSTAQRIMVYVPPLVALVLWQKKSKND